MKRMALSGILVWIIGIFGLAQDDPGMPGDSIGHRHTLTFAISGYVKYLQSSFLTSGDFAGAPAEILEDVLGGSLHDHLIHARLNGNLELDHRFAIRFGCRFRTFYGDQPRLTHLLGSDYGREIDRYANDRLDLSGIWLDKPSWVMHMVLDRAFLEWRGHRDEVRVGRQRINWGKGSLWNPNDLFNAYSFIDFDYEERPGTDGLRWTHSFGTFSSFELGVRAADSLNGSTAAVLVKTYWKGVNVQALAGYYRNDLALGGGWEADLGQWAWKGEGTVFVPLDPEAREGTAVALSTDWMRTWPSGFLAGGGYLLNTAAGSGANLFADLNERVDARNLYPYRHSLFAQIGYPVSPLFNTNLAVVYSPGEEHTLFISPVLSYSLANDWDLDLTGQIVARDNGRHLVSPVQAFFLRLRWSY